MSGGFITPRKPFTLSFEQGNEMVIKKEGVELSRFPLMMSGISTLKAVVNAPKKEKENENENEEEKKDEADPEIECKFMIKKFVNFTSKYFYKN